MALAFAGSYSYTMSTSLRFASSPIQALAAPTIVAALFITLAAVFSLGLYSVLLPFENPIIRALLWSPCAACGRCRGTVFAQTTALLGDVLSDQDARALGEALPGRSAGGDSGGRGADLDGPAGASVSRGGSADDHARGLLWGAAPPGGAPLPAASSASLSLNSAPGAAADARPVAEWSGAARDASGTTPPAAHSIGASAPPLERPLSDGSDTVLSLAAVASAARLHEEAAAAAAAEELGLPVHRMLLQSCRAVDRLAAAARLAHAAALCCIAANAIVVGAAGLFDWDAFLFTYLDPMHLPAIQYRYTVGPSVIVLLVATALLLAVGAALYVAWQRRHRAVILLLRGVALRTQHLS
jgi:hypothetical protein